MTLLFDAIRSDAILLDNDDSEPGDFSSVIRLLLIERLVGRAILGGDWQGVEGIMHLSRELFIASQDLAGQFVEAFQLSESQAAMLSIEAVADIYQDSQSFDAVALKGVLQEILNSSNFLESVSLSQNDIETAQNFAPLLTLAESLGHVATSLSRFVASKAVMLSIIEMLVESLAHLKKEFKELNIVAPDTVILRICFSLYRSTYEAVTLIDNVELLAADIEKVNDKYKENIALYLLSIKYLPELWCNE